MTIKTRLSGGVTNVLVADTLVIDPSDRIAVSAFSLFNTTGASINITIFESPNTTSAAGDQIAEYDIATLASVSVDEVIGQGYASNENIIVVADAVGVNARFTFTQYSGDSV